MEKIDVLEASDLKRFLKEIHFCQVSGQYAVVIMLPPFQEIEYYMIASFKGQKVST